MDRTTEQLFSLLNTALWKKETDYTLFEGKTDWKALFILAQRQTVFGCVFDAITTLPTHLLPPKDILLKGHLLQNKTEQYNELLNDVIRDLCGKLDNAGIRSVLLKGQGLAQNYPNPLRRSCGDIDLYVGSENYELAFRKLKEWGMLNEGFERRIHHILFEYRGVPIEIHKIAGLLYSPTGFARFIKWSKNLLDGKNGNRFPCREAEFNGQSVLLPPVQFDSLFVFSHLYGHLISGGIGLRQIVDFTMYLHHFNKEIDLNVLYRDLNKMGLLKAWKTFGHIVTKYMGLPVEEYPFYDCEYSETADFILNRLILKHGNFGFYGKSDTPRPKGYFSGKLHSFNNLLSYLQYTNKAFGTANNINYMMFYIFKGLGNIAGDTMDKLRKRN